MGTAARNTFFALDNHFYQAGIENPSSVATDGLAGTLYIQVPVYPATSPFAVWQKQDNGETTNWILFGGGGPSPASSDTFVYQPGGTAVGNRYTDWATLYAAVLATRSGSNAPITIWMDNTYGTVSIPAGSYDFLGVRVKGLGDLGDARVPVTVDDGAEIANMNYFEDVDMTFDNTSVVDTVSTNRLIALDNTGIIENGSSPIWEIQSGSVFTVAMLFGANVAGDDTTPASTGPAFGVLSGGTLTIVQFNGNYGGENSIQSPLGSTVNIVYIDAASGYTNVQPALLGAFNYNQLSLSDRINYQGDQDNFAGPAVTVTEAISDLAKRETSFIYAPGAVQEGNKYNSFPDLYAAMLLCPGPKTLYLSDEVLTPVVIPFGNYNFDGVTIANVHQGVPIICGVDPDTTWTGVRKITGINLDFNNTTNPTFDLSAEGLILDGANLTNSGTVVAFTISTTAQVQMLGGSSMTGNGTCGLVAIAANESLQLIVGQVSQVAANAIQGDPTTTLITIFPDVSAVTYVPQTVHFSGTENEQLLTRADHLAYSPAVPADWTPVPTEVAQALDILASVSGAGGPFNPKQVYVDIAAGSDVTGIGSILLPFQTIPAALTYIAGAGAGDYVIILAAGTYSGAPIAWPGNVSLTAPPGGNLVSVTHDINYTSGAGTEIIVFSNIGFGTINVDLTAGGISLLFISSGAVQNLVRTDAAVGAKFVQLYNVNVQAFDITQNIIFYNCLLISGGPYVIQATGRGIFTSSLVAAGITINGAGVLSLSSCLTAAGVSIFTGVGGGTVSTDSSSLEGGGTVAGSAVLSFSDNASREAYTPTTPADWVVVPTTVQEGLDELASTLTSGDAAVEPRIVSAPEAAAKQIVLANAPSNPAEVSLAYQGVEQQIGVDFTVTGSTVDWTGLGLDTIGVVAGEFMVFTFAK